MTTPNLILQLQTFPAVGMSTGGTGSPSLTRYRKEIVKVGKYVKASADQAFEVTSALLDHWISTFQRWVKNGNRVPVPLGHEAATVPEKNVGWVHKLYREADTLIAEMELLDPALALTTDVSICVPNEVIDGKGEKYSRPITHVALCVDPVVPGLGKFTELSLSLSKGDINMELVKLAALLNVEESALTEEMIIAALDVKRLVAPAAVPAPAGVVAAPPLAASQTSTVDPVITRLVSENRTGKLSTLVAAGLLTPAIKEVIAAKYVKKEALTLSLSRGGNDEEFDLLIKVLTENKAVPLGEVSGVQLLELSNTRATPEVSPMAADTNRRREAVGLTN